MENMLGIDSMLGADEKIVLSLLRADEKIFTYLKKDIKKQLQMMPEIEKYRLKAELEDLKIKQEKAKSLGFELLNRNFIH